MKKFAGAAGPLITLVVGLVMLFAGLAALLLANSLWGQLQETQGQLEEARVQLQDAQSELQKTKGPQQTTNKAGAGAAGREPATANKSLPQDNTKNQTQNAKSSAQQGQDQQRAMLLRMQEDGGSSVPYLLLLSLGLVVLASLMLVAMSAVRLLSGGSRSDRSGAGFGAGPGVSAPSHAEQPPNVEAASPLEDGRWIKLVEECVEVIDELDEHMDSFDPPRREVAGHVIMRLEEILGRSGVEIISDDAIFDRARHKADAEHAATDNGVAVRETLSPGFAIGQRVLRRARVQLE